MSGHGQRRQDRGTVKHRLRTWLAYERARGVWPKRLLLLVGGVFLLGGVWIVVTGVLAARAAQHVESDLIQAQNVVSSGQLDRVGFLSADVAEQAHRAHVLTTGPAWWIAATIPFLGAPAEVVRGATSASDQLGSSTVPILIELADQLSPRKLRRGGNSISLAPLIAAAPRLTEAAAAVDGATRTLADLPQATWLHPVDSVRQRLGAELSTVGGYVDAADRTAQVLPAMAGATTPQRYFVGLQNEAELRGTGGLPGAFAIMLADHGSVTFSHVESDVALLPAGSGDLITTGLDFGAAYQAAWGPSGPTSLYPNSNLSPDFPYAAQVWAAMWQEVSGEQVNGAIAMDPTVLSYFLAVTGPAALPDGTPVTAQNVVSLSEKDEYALYPDPLARKNFLVDLIHATDAMLLSGAGSPAQLVQAGVRAAKEQRLMIWAADPTIEKVLAGTGFGGSVPRGSQPFAGLVLNNTASGKLDYYLTRLLSYQRTGCGVTRDVLVTITLTNNAPASGLPSYVTTRYDSNAAEAKPGDNRLLVEYLATSGAQLLSATVDGHAATVGMLTESGHPAFRYDLELPRGRTATIVLHLREPAASGLPVIWRQPGVAPLAVSSFNQPCG